MSEQYTFVDRSLTPVVWSQENLENVNNTLSSTLNETYETAEDDSPTRYLSVLDATSEISLENLTLTNPKLEIQDNIDNYIATSETVEQNEENNDQVVVFSVEGSDELFGIQVLQDEEGNMQKYQFQFRQTEDGQLEAIPETITLVPFEQDLPDINQQIDDEYAQPVEEAEDEIEELHNVGADFVQEEEHILPDDYNNHLHGTQMKEEMYQNERAESVNEEEFEDIKPILHVSSVKHEAVSYEPMEDEIFQERTEEMPVEFEHHYEDVETPTPEFNNENDVQIQDVNYERESEPLHNIENTINSQEFEHVEVNPDVNPELTEEEIEANGNDSDENEYQIVEGVHITGDIENVLEEPIVKEPNVLKQAINNKDTTKLVKKDNKLYLYVVQQPHLEKENVDASSLIGKTNFLKSNKINPRSILKSSHAMLQSKNADTQQMSLIDNELSNKRFARGKEAMQAMMFQNFISKTTIPQAPVRKDRLPRKQKIKPVERMDEEIVVQEVMVSSNGFVESIQGGPNKETVTGYVELIDSDDDYDPKQTTRRRKSSRRRRVEITISDEDSNTSDSIIELDETDDEIEEAKKNTESPSKRRRGRPPKNKTHNSDTDSPAKKTKTEVEEHLKKPEIPCPQCDKTFPSQNSLKTHLQHHSLQSSLKKAQPDYKYKCDNCEKTFINNILLKKHMCSKLFSCSICKRQFSDISALNSHKRTHAKEQMIKSTTVVQVSPKQTKTTNTFKVPSTNFKCKTCGKLCSSLQNLAIHVKTHKEYPCSTCSKNFQSQLLLEKHLRENCVKSPINRRATRYKSTSSLDKLPIKMPSSPPKKTPAKQSLQIKCEQCTMQFRSFQDVFRHKVLRHNVETPDKSVLKSVRKSERKERSGIVPVASKLQGLYEEIGVSLD